MVIVCEDWQKDCWTREGAIKAWLSRVRGYYEEALFKMKKYFSASIKSKTLRALSVLSPKSWTNQFGFSENVEETPRSEV